MNNRADVSRNDSSSTQCKTTFRVAEVHNEYLELQTSPDDRPAESFCDLRHHPTVDRAAEWAHVFLGAAGVVEL